MSHVVAVRLSNGEWTAFQGLMEKSNLTAQQLLHGVIIDALVEDGYDALRCEQPEGCESSGEASEVRGSTAS